MYFSSHRVVLHERAVTGTDRCALTYRCVKHSTQRKELVQNTAHGPHVALVAVPAAKQWETSRQPLHALINYPIIQRAKTIDRKHYRSKNLGHVYCW